jgi:hypothetical protein
MPKNPKQTSKEVASKAGRELQDKKTPDKYKAPIASAVAQAPLKSKKK